MTPGQRGIHDGIHGSLGAHGTMDPCPTGTNGGNGGQMDMTDDAFSTGSTSPSASIEVKVTIYSLPMDAEAGSSVEVYLEDDFPGSRLH